jgi:hypothetical protein
MLQNEEIPFCTRCVYVRVLISILFSALFPLVNSRKLFEIHVKVILRINQIALSICVALSFRTHVERLNCIMGTQTCRSDCVINWLSYGIGCALATQCSICVIRTWLRHVIAMSQSRLIGPLLLSRTAIVESHIIRMPCRHFLSAVIIKP